MSNNIFEMLYPKDEAAVLQYKALIAAAIVKQVRERGLKQFTAAVEAKVHQPRMSNIMRGKLDGITLDTLVRVLYRLGGRATLSINV